MRHLKFTVCLSLAVSTAAACAQIMSDATSSSPVAYVYVASTPENSKTNEIVAYSAAANGSLSPVTGSPFPGNVSSMAVNGKYLMGVNVAKPDIDAFKIESDGALSYATSTNYAQYNNPPYGCGIAGQPFFDYTGATLYLMEFEASDACANNIYASFGVVKATGGLKYLGLAITGTFPGVNSAADFIGNDVYAYTADNSSCMYFAFYGFKRRTNGLLSGFNVKANLPPPPPGARGYVPNQAAADMTNHLVFTMQPANPPDCASGPLQLASYTAESNGNLRTTNTHSNMPAPLISSIIRSRLSPGLSANCICGYGHWGVPGTTAATPRGSGSSFGSFLPSLWVGFGTSNSTQGREPTLSWNQLHSLAPERGF